MNRDEFSEKLAARGGLTESKARDLCNLIFDGDDGILARELAKQDGSVNFAGFGKLEVRTLKARTCRNPATGESFEAPAKRVVRWKVGKNLKAKVSAKPPKE